MPMTAQNRIDKGQIKRIHVLKSLLMKAGKITEDDYRIRVQDIHGFSCSSKDLTFGEADTLEHQLETMAIDAGLWQRYDGARIKRLGFGRKYEDLATRPGMASPSQLRMLEAMWAEVRRADMEHHEKSFKSFLTHHFKVSHPRFIERWQVSKIKKALEAMGAGRTQSPERRTQTKAQRRKASNGK